MYHSDLIGGVAARLLGYKRVVWGVRNNELDEHARRTRAVAKLCALISPFVPRAITCCAVAAIDHHHRLGYRGSWCVIPNGYSIKDFDISDDSRQRVRSELGVDEEFLFGFVARWDPMKDHMTLLRALRMWASKKVKPGFRLVLVGSGCDESNEKLLDMIRDLELKNNVLLLGQRSNIPAIMNALDLHVLSSKSEAFPNVIAEAMACGTPCLATDVGDAAEIVGNTGWIVPAKSARCLADGIELAYTHLQDVDNRTEMSTICRERIVENYSLERMVTSFKQVWAGETEDSKKS